MYKGLKTISILLFVVMAVALFAEKPLERIANEQGVEAEGFYQNKDFAQAGPKFEEALATLEEAVSTDGIPMDSEKKEKWLLYAYQSYLQDKDYTNALRVQDMRIATDPTEYKLTKEKAIIQTKYVKDPTSGIATLTAFDAANASFSARKLAASYYEKYLKDNQNALLWYQKALELRQDTKVIQEIASLHQELGNNNEAVKAWEDYIQSETKEAKLNIAYKKLATLYDDLGNNSKSIQYFEKANNLKSDDKIVLLLMTKYFDSGNFDKTLEKASEYSSLKPGNLDSIYYQAMVKYERGDKAGASAEFEKLVNDSKYGKIAKGYIESIKSE